MAQLPGIGSHQSARAQTVEWLTPPQIIRALGDFDLDPCAPSDRPWPTARQHITKAEDGLAHEWHGRVWLNPPYGTEATAWLRRMASHANGIALIFARTETQMFQRYVWPYASGLLFVAGRLHFHHPDGTRAKANSGAPSVVVAYDTGYGNLNSHALRDSGILGAYVDRALLIGD